MYTFYDYLKYYKDYELKDIPWNIMDNLLCAIIVYMPLPSFKYSRTLNSIYDELSKMPLPKTSDYMTPKPKEIINIIRNSKRYKNMRIKNFVNIIDDNTQFGALTCMIRNVKVVSFKGSDKSVIGWLENFRIIYDYPTYTQKLAIQYLKNNINLLDSSVYVTGHSKGGNLAMVSAMEVLPHDFSKIKQIVNFDGPGFRKEEYISDKYTRIKDKLVNIIPTSSYIGVLLYNDNYRVVTTNSHAINVHYPMFWNSYGTVFIDGKQSKLSKDLHQMASKNITDISNEEIRYVIEESFSHLDKTSSISLMLVLNVLKSVRGADNKTLKYLRTILNSMLKLSSEKE